MPGFNGSDVCICNFNYSRIWDPCRAYMDVAMNCPSGTLEPSPSIPPNGGGIAAAVIVV